MEAILLSTLLLFSLACVGFMAYRITLWLERISDWWIRL